MSMDFFSAKLNPCKYMHTKYCNSRQYPSLHVLLNRLQRPNLNEILMADASYISLDNLIR